ncbi:hypothetical protein KJ657_03995 [Patescibacteria group bacterium]|nr:hypothetical protein [Patescibacteria group bacterium]MBU1016226.1 hypothetical protein [Patescibacteria group bacterium]
MIKKVYNLEFRPYSNEMKIGDYIFKRVEDYPEKRMKLQHLGGISDSEFTTVESEGSNQITATVDCPEKERASIFPCSDENTTHLQDVLLLLTIFTKRNVFSIDDDEKGLIVADCRQHNYGGSLTCSLPYQGEIFDKTTMKILDIKQYDEYQYPHRCQTRDITLEKGINKILDLISKKEWQQKYGKGYYLFLYRQAVEPMNIEAHFILCWTIWEHLFSLHNKKWLPEKSLEKTSGSEKIAYILTEYFVHELDSNAHKEISKLKDARDRIIHFGKRPTTINLEDMGLFIHATECLVAKTLELNPSQIYDVDKRLAKFLHISKAS